MNRLALSWVDVALELDQENVELRRLLGALLVEVARSRDLAAYAHEYVDARYPLNRKEGRRAA